VSKRPAKAGFLLVTRAPRPEKVPKTVKTRWAGRFTRFLAPQRPLAILVETAYSSVTRR
jgi:hypothetical protein